jgi:hypothetical protein
MAVPVRVLVWYRAQYPGLVSQTRGLWDTKRGFHAGGRSALLPTETRGTSGARGGLAAGGG